MLFSINRSYIKQLIVHTLSKCILLYLCVMSCSFATPNDRLLNAIKNPEYVLTHWIDLPTAPASDAQKNLHLTLREAILLALRYNPNIQNAELDRIVQRYQLRLAQNEFELQYALAGSAMIQNTAYSGIGRATTRNYIATPVFNIKNKLGTQASLSMDNRVAIDGNYTPLVDFEVTQPLLRGFGIDVNQASLLNAVDREELNKLSLHQSVGNQITQVILSYRSLILSGNNLQNTQYQLTEAEHLFAINEKKIAAGELEPTVNIQQSYQIESLKMMLEQANYDLKTSAQELLENIGLSPEINVSVPSDIDLSSLTIPDMKQAIDMALTHDTQYVALKLALRADKRDYLIAKNQQLWQLDATGNMQLGRVTGVDTTTTNNQINSIYNGRNVNESVGLRLTIPLHDMNRRNQLISAKIRLEQDRVNIKAAKRVLVSTIKNTINSIRSQAKRYELAKRQLTLASQSYELEKKRQQAGIASSLDVNNTQNQLILAQMGLINSKIAYLNQLSTLQQLIGSTLEQWQINLRFTG